MDLKQRILDCLSALACVMVCAGAQAEALQPPEDLARTATDFLTARMNAAADPATHIYIESTGVDPRLRLPRCATALQGFAAGEPGGGARATVGVRCEQPAWKVYVPVRVETETSVLVLRRALARGSAITAEDVEAQTRRVPGLAAGFITDTAQLAGRHLRVTASPGATLSVDLLDADVLIRRGQRVTLIAAVGGLEVRAQGEAVMDAQPNGRVRVLNLESRRVVEGQAESRDSVRVSL